MISSQGVHGTFIYNMDKFCILIVIWSIVLDIWDDVHILVRALNWLSGEPPTGRVAVPSLIYPPFPFKDINNRWHSEIHINLILALCTLNIIAYIKSCPYLTI